jgi:hypothetical protein
MCFLLEVLQMAQDLAGEGAAEVAEENEGESLLRRSLREGLPGGQAVGLAGFGHRERFLADRRPADMGLHGGPQDRGEREPPDEVVEECQPEGLGREFIGEDRSDQQDDHQRGLGEAEQNQRPVADRIARGDQEADAENRR